MSAASKPIPKAADGSDLFTDFAATCFYFASSLTDFRREQQQQQHGASHVDVPIGLIATAVGGSQIEVRRRLSLTL